MPCHAMLPPGFVVHPSLPAGAAHYAQWHANRGKPSFFAGSQSSVHRRPSEVPTRVCSAFRTLHRRRLQRCKPRHENHCLGLPAGGIVDAGPAKPSGLAWHFGRPMMKWMPASRKRLFPLFSMPLCVMSGGGGQHGRMNGEPERKDGQTSTAPAPFKGPVHSSLRCA